MIVFRIKNNEEYKEIYYCEKELIDLISGKKNNIRRNNNSRVIWVLYENNLV